MIEQNSVVLITEGSSPVDNTNAAAFSNRISEQSPDAGLDSVSIQSQPQVDNKTPEETTSCDDHDAN